MDMATPAYSGTPSRRDFPGVQAEYVDVPYSDVSLLPNPDSVPDGKVLYPSDVLYEWPLRFRCGRQPGQRGGGVGPRVYWNLRCQA